MLALGVLGGRKVDYSSRVLLVEPNSIIGYWRLDETTGTIAYDSSGNGRNVAYRNSPALGKPGIPGDIGKSVLLDGVNDSVNLDNASLAAAIDGEEGTALIWVKIDSSQLADGLAHTFFYLGGLTAGNSIEIRKAAQNNVLTAIYSAGGVLRLYDFAPGAVLGGFVCCAIRWSYKNNQMRFSVAGIPSPSAFPGGVGLWAGDINRDKMLVSGLNLAATGVIKANVAHVVIWDKFLSDGQIYQLSGTKRLDNTLHPRFTRISTQSLYRENVSTQDWLGRPFLCNNDGQWLMVYRQAIDHASSDASVAWHIRLSDDEGATWSNADCLPNGTAITGAPFVPHATNTGMTDAIIFRAPNGDLIFQVFEKPGDTGTYQYRSADDGATWLDEGKILSDAGIIGGQDYFLVGSNIYLPIMYSPTEDGDHPFIDALYKSTDNGATWAKVADITTGTDDSELSILHAGGNNLLCVMKDVTANKTYKYLSSDMGVTWGAPIDITSQVSVLQRPRLRQVGSIILLYGRDRISPASLKTVCYVSTDNGATFGEKFYPDTGDYQDGAYCDVLTRTGGQYYMLSYAGLIGKADIKEYIFS